MIFDIRKDYPELFFQNLNFGKSDSADTQKVIPNISLRNASVTGFH